MAEEKLKSTQAPITFLQGEETDVVIARTKEQMEQSLLREQYIQALDVVNDIIVGSSHENEKGTPVSNIVAFCGDRGEGKTSALLTVHNILRGKESFENAEEVKLFPKKNKITKDSFKVLKLVEPAFFDENHHLIELLIGQMYADILRADREMWNDDNRRDLTFNENVASRNRLMQHFQEVRSSLKIINTPSNQSPYDNLEDIDQLAAGIELKEKINELLHYYAKYFGKERVLISIDDLDLNVTEGYPMAEEIRKYLSSPRVCVVMIAIKEEQLVEVVQSYLRKQLNTIVPGETITEMAIRYVTKLLPLSHRVMMPTGDNIVEKPLVLKNEKETESFESVKEAVVRLIYRKTRYIFVNGRNLSPIVPTNLRDVRHLIGLLCNMLDVTNTSGEEIIRNKSVFKHYFYRTWVRNLEKNDATFVEELVENEDLVSINKSVMLHLRKKLLDLLNDKEYKFEGTLGTLLDPLNTMQNVSLGDVYYVLKYIDDIATSIDDKNLVFFLRAFYSILLYDTYNFVSESEKHLFVNDEDKKPSIYKYDEELRHLNKLQRLINGSYFTYELGSFMPAEKSIPREKRVIDGNTLKLMIGSLRNTDEETRAKILPLCEFFVLTTCYPTYSKQGVEYNKKMSSRSYYAQFSTTNNYVVFDVLSIFYNLINVKFTYQRWNKIFGGDFYEFALEERNDSLLKNILNKCVKMHPAPKSKLSNELHSLITEATIRFSEVQLAIIDHLCNHRDISKEGGNANNIRIVYSAIRNIGIKLYPLVEKDESNRYEMKFYFLSPIIDFLKNVGTNDFDEVYSITDSKNVNIDYTNLSLDEIFSKSLAKKRTQYPKTKNGIINKLRYYDPKLYNANTEMWLQIIDNKQYASWTELRTELNPHIDEIRKLYQNINS